LCSMKLLIAIPALNEEQSVAATIERCLAAREQILTNTTVTAVEVTVVSDGSTDRTAEIAGKYIPHIRLIEFKNNQGYGAAITEAWRQSDAELLGFLDADGTCDPRLFEIFCKRLIDEDADVVLGSRMHGNSRMPLVRRIGNKLFAWMLTLLSFSRVNDAASGMRVVKRSSLTKLYPLPRGLHFTPAMSARAALSRDLKLIEVDMPYREREGQSKLEVFKDGLRFLNAILEMALLYRPTRPLGFGALTLLFITAMMMLYPIYHYFQYGVVEEWMIYRFLVGELLSAIAVLMFCLAYLGRKSADISLSSQPERDAYRGVTGWLFGRQWFWMIPVVLLIVGLLFVRTGLWEFLTTGEVHQHWSRFVAMALCFTVAAVLSATKVVDYGLNLLAERLAYLRSAGDPVDLRTY
jgi:glycosyltransferase involved in cell wall biosynthesis